MNRVVITGAGVYSCIGNNKEEVKASLYAGKSGIGLEQLRTDMGYMSALTGILEPVNLKGILHRRYKNTLSQPGEFAFMATKEALEQASINEDYLDNHEVGIIYGNDSTADDVIAAHERLKVKNDTALLGSGSIFKAMNSTITMNLSTIYKLKGINFTISGACASGSHSIGMGYLLIKQGLQQMVICGGAQEVNANTFGSFDGINAFSKRESDPQKASRPFDSGRDGLVPSGGGATVILESLENAQRRGANIIAEVIGYGFSSNGSHISQPSVEGPARALKMCVDQAGLKPSEVDYINAHATSTPIGDKYEAQALNEIFGEAQTPISSTKSMTGHECWMAGASEIVYSLIMMENDFIAPNINLEHPDEDSSKLNIIRDTHSKKISVFLSNSFGFGGTNSSLIVRKI